MDGSVVMLLLFVKRMRPFAALILVSLALFSCQSDKAQPQNGGDSQTVTQQGVGMQKHTVLEVRGMSCGGCEQAITERLSALDGVRSVKADRKTERTWVTYTDAHVNADLLAAEIKELGYEARVIDEAWPTDGP